MLSCIFFFFFFEVSVPVAMVLIISQFSGTHPCLILTKFSNRYDEQLEEMLDQAYERYITRKGGSTKPTKRAKRVASTDGADLMEV